MAAQWMANPANAGGTYDTTYPWRIVLHTIEGSAAPAMIQGHRYPPHLWYQPDTRALYQTVPFDRSAFALEHPAGTPETNKARALQVEIGGRAADAGNWPAEWLDNITADVVVPLCQWVAAQGGQIDLADAPDPGAIPGSASPDAPQRMTEAQWRTFRGVCGHRHVPNNEHWDPGALDLDRIVRHAALTIGGLLAAATSREEDPMPWIGRAQNGTYLMFDGNTVHPIDRPWPDALAGLLHLEAVGRIEKIPRDASGNLVAPVVPDPALALYKVV